MFSIPIGPTFAMFMRATLLSKYFISDFVIIQVKKFMDLIALDIKISYF